MLLKRNIITSIPAAILLSALAGASSPPWTYAGPQVICLPERVNAALNSATLPRELDQFDVWTPEMRKQYIGKRIQIDGSDRVTGLPQWIHPGSALLPSEKQLAQRLLKVSGHRGGSLAHLESAEVIRRTELQRWEHLKQQTRPLVSKLEFDLPHYDTMDDWVTELGLTIKFNIADFQDYLASTRALAKPRESGIAQSALATPAGAQWTALQKSMTGVDVNRMFARKILERMNHAGFVIPESEKNITVLAHEMERWSRNNFNALIAPGVFREVAAFQVTTNRGRRMTVLTTSNRSIEINASDMIAAVRRIERRLGPEEVFREVDFFHTHPNDPLLSREDGESFLNTLELLSRLHGPELRFRSHAVAYSKGQVYVSRIGYPETP